MVAATDWKLDWSDRSHIGRRPGPCRHCGRYTPLRDHEGAPAHKTCAEEALVARRPPYGRSS